MTDYEMLKKLRDAVAAIEEFQSEKRTLDSSIWTKEIDVEIDRIKTKRHVLGAAGRSCSRCHGTGLET